MKFCNKCGKPLQEGEICSCQSGQAQSFNTQQNPQQDAQQNTQQQGTPVQQPVNNNSQAVNNILTDIQKVFKSFIADPFEAAENFSNSKNTVLAILFLVIYAISAGFERLLYLTTFDFYEGSDYIESFLCVSLQTVAQVAVSALIIWLLVNNFAKIKTDYMKFFSLYTLYALISSPAYIISGILRATDVSFLRNLGNGCVTAAYWFTSVAVLLIVHRLVKNNKNASIIMACATFASSMAQYLVGCMF